MSNRYPRMTDEKERELVAQIKPLLDAGYTPDEVISELDLSRHSAHRIIRLIKGLTYDEYVNYLLSLK